MRTGGGESRSGIGAGIGAADRSSSRRANATTGSTSIGTGAATAVPSQRNPDPPNVLRFQRPRSSVVAEIGSDEEQFIFPPTIFTDATYNRGILVPNNDNGAQREDGGFGNARRVAKDFDGTVHLGTVTDYNSNGFVQLWHVTYDDGDEEDFNRKELDDAIALYKQQKRGGDDEDEDDNDGRCAISNVEIELPYDYFGPDHHNIKCRDLMYGYGGCITDALSSTSRSTIRRTTGSTSGGNVRVLPVLTPEEAAMWTHKNAAHAAAHRRFPSQALRLLGTITLYFDEWLDRTSMDTKKKKKKGSNRTLDDVGLFAQSSKHCDKYRSHYVSRSGIPRRPDSNYNKFNRTITPKQATAEAMAEMNIEVGTDPAVLSAEVQGQLQARAEQIIQCWKRVKGTPPLRECWNQKNGAFVREALEASVTSGDADPAIERHIPVSVLLEWIKNDDDRHRPNDVKVIGSSRGKNSFIVQWAATYPD